MAINMEYWDVYDINRQKTGGTVQRGQKHSDDEYRLVVHVCIFNSNGQMLIQQRQPFKKDWSGMWDVTVGGGSVSGETSSAAAERETLEEIGLKLDLSKTRPHFTINFSDGFDDWYIVKQDVDISNLTLQYEEVKQAKWADKEEIIKMLLTGEFIPYRQALIEMIFEIGAEGFTYGAHRA